MSTPGKGIIRIRIVKATGLRKADWGIGAKSDPYVTVVLHEDVPQSHKTVVSVRASFRGRSDG